MIYLAAATIDPHIYENFTCSRDGAAGHWGNGGLFFFFFVFSGLHPRHMEVPRLGDESERQLLAYATATEMRDASCIWDLHHSSWQHQILSPLSEPGDRTCILMHTSWVC